MIKKMLVAGALALLLVGAVGCYSTQEGRVKTGMPFVKDTIHSRYEAVTLAEVRAAIRTVLQTQGSLSNDDTVTQVIRGMIDGCHIWVKLDDSEPKIVAVTIQARTKAGGRDLEMASEVDKMIYGVLMQNR